MKKVVFRALFFLTLGAACNSGETITGYKSHEILVVTLDIEDSVTFNKITLQSSYGKYTDSVLGKKVNNKRTIKLKCPQKGEGTFSLHVITNKDTLYYRGGYIEGGYRPRLKLKNKKIETVKWL